MGQETWILIWYCVTTTNPACMKWDGATEKLVTSFNSQAVCISYAKEIARKVHSSLHFDIEYLCRKGVPPEPYTPNRHPSFQTETLQLNEDGNGRYCERYSRESMRRLRAAAYC
jgi:hypothetical protein